MKNYYLSVILFLSVFLFSQNNKLLAQTCNTDPSLPGENLLEAGEVGCISADFFGTITVQDGGVLIICGRYDMQTSVTINPGGKLILMAGTRVNFTGTVTLNSNGVDPVVVYQGDPTCSAQLVETFPGVGSVSGATNPAGSPWGVTNDSQIHLSGFSWILSLIHI